MLSAGIRIRGLYALQRGKTPPKSRLKPSADIRIRGLYASAEWVRPHPKVDSSYLRGLEFVDCMPCRGVRPHPKVDSSYLRGLEFVDCMPCRDGKTPPKSRLKLSAGSRIRGLYALKSG